MLGLKPAPSLPGVCRHWATQGGPEVDSLALGCAKPSSPLFCPAQLQKLCSGPSETQILKLGLSSPLARALIQTGSLGFLRRPPHP